MRRLQLFGCIALSLMLGCSGCTDFVLRHTDHQSLSPRHNVRVLWVMDSVMAKMQAAANDSVEAMFQVTQLGVGQLCPKATYPESEPCYYGSPADSAYLVLDVVECPAHDAVAMRVRAKCPNPLAPTIHIHTHGPQYGPIGNTCSPSQPDYALQMVGRHLFDAVLCGSNTRPSVWWFFQNPLLGTKAYADTIMPFSGMTKELR